MNETLIRDPVASDWPYFADCIRNGLKTGCIYAKGLSAADITDLCHPILSTYKSKVLVPVAETNSILGFILYRPVGPGSDEVAWIQVRKEFRKQGLARELFKAAQVTPPYLAPFVTRLGLDMSCQVHFRPWIPQQIRSSL